MNGFGHLSCITVTGDVHIHHAGQLSDEMVMDSCRLNPALLQHEQYGLDLALGKNKIAHHHSGTGILFEGDPGTEGEGGLDLDAIERDTEVFSWHAKLDDVARLALTWASHGSFNRFPIGRGLA